jgi:serine phosphatase RsbU (regulator of sigma subunit)
LKMGRVDFARKDVAVVKNVSARVAHRMPDASQQLLERNEEMEHDLMAARAVQRFLLPPESQDFGTCRVTHLYHPLHHIGGDFLDTVVHPSGEILMLVADVSGHGVAAAMSSAMLKTVFVRHAMTTTDPGEILTQIDHDLAGMVRFGRFITALVVAFNPADRTVQVASAGHPQPLLVRNGTTAVVNMETEMPLLTGETPRYPTAARAKLEPGDRLLMYTDGVIEVPDRAGRMLGVDGLSRLVAQVDGSQAGFLETIFERLFFGEFAFRDDVSFMCLSCSS